ncbi:MAG: cyclic nucleotide-binding domain-containing protein [Thermodesulfobacteriota bacterium]
MNGPSVLQGDLSFVSLADLFQLLGGNNSTGVLEVKSPYAPSTAAVYFQNGDPIDASNGNAKGVEAVNSLFGWMEGTFIFHLKPVQAPRTIKMSRMQIMLDALRLLDEGEIDKVGPLQKDDSQTERRKGTGSVLWKSMPVIRGPVVDYMYVVEEEEFADGHQVVAEGRHGNWIWIVLEGELEILRETPKGPIVIARLGPGSFVGTFMIFLFEGTIRSANVKAIGNVRLGLLDTQRLYGEFASLSAEFRSLLLSLSRRLIKISDRAVDLYCGTKKSPITIKDKEVFLKAGTTREQAYIISSGETCLVYKTRKGRLPLISLGREDVFGNLPFLSTGQEPHSASVFASKDLEVKKIDPAKLQTEYSRLSVTFRSLIETVCTSISVTSQIACHLAEQKTR